jgi:hypothetical protein
MIKLNFKLVLKSVKFRLGSKVGKIGRGGEVTVEIMLHFYLGRD